MELNKIYCGDSLEVLKTFPDECIDCVVTSPPYWALRDYGVDGQLGLEMDYNLYISKLCDIFDEVKRVLKKGGTCWVNIGDTYGTKSGSGFANDNLNPLTPEQIAQGTGIYRANELRGTSPSMHKNLCNIPSRFSIEMQNRGWILRNEIIWHKPNCMPSSVRDRFTVDFEKIFFFVKSKKYYFDNEVVAEEAKHKEDPRAGYGRIHYRGKRQGYAGTGNENFVVIKNKRNKRSVWTVTTKPYKGAHFACVDSKTEILTIDGWKKYTDIRWYKSSPHHILVATYNLQKQVIEYQPLSYLKEYDCQKMIQVGKRDLDILMTPNHRNIVKKRNGSEKIVLAEQLSYSDKIRVSADVQYPENNGIGKTFAELIGWIISEGCYKNGNILIYQNEGYKAKRIDYLLDTLELHYTRHTRRTNQVSWYLKKSPLTEWCLRNIPDKKLIRFLVSLPLIELKALFNGLIMGDGHIRKSDGRICFIQKNKETKDWFQIIALRLGYHSIQTDNKVFLTKRTHIGIRKTNGTGKNINYVSYHGKVWCPKTPNGTWVARRNGRIFITGNTYPEALIEPCIKAGCPPNGIVLDPFFGAGTTGVVAKKQQKSYIGIELNKSYCNLAEKRIQEILI